MTPGGRLDDLVRAAIGRDDSLAAWRRYLAAGGTQSADDGERRLYPFVAQAMAAATQAVPQLAMLRAERRKAVVRVERVFAAAAQAIDSLETHGVEAILLKGQALQVRVFRDGVQRVSSDVDLFIAPNDLAPAIAAFSSAGWVPVNARQRGLAPDAIRAMFAGMTWRAADGMEFDLHWLPRPVLEFDADAATDFRAEATHRSFAGRSWRIPSDTWLLFEAIEHGLRRNEVTPVRWVIDAVSMIEAPDSAIDWTALIARVERNRLSALFAHGLRTLTRYTPAIPTGVLDRLDRARPAWVERRHARLTMAGPVRWSQWFELTAWHYALRGPGPPGRRLLAFPEYYRLRRLHVPGWRDLGREVRLRIGDRK